MVPDPSKIEDENKRKAVMRSLEYMGLEPNQKIQDIKTTISSYDIIILIAVFLW